MRIWRAELLWLMLVVVLLVLAVWWLPGGSSLATDSYSTSFSGKKALFQTLRRLQSEVSRSTERLIPPLAQGDRLLILGPARSPTAEEWDALYHEVRDGAALVYAASSADAFADATIFGAQVVPFLGISPFGADDDGADSGDDHEQTSDSSSDDNTDKKAPVPALFLDKFTADTELVEGQVEWKTRAEIKFEADEADDWDVLLAVDSRPQVARRRVGAGTVVLVTSDEVFTNQALTEPDRALLAYRIVESAPGPGRTWIDESLNRSGVPKVLGILFDPLIRPLTLQLFLIATLFGWSGSSRFGAAEPPAAPRRRSIVEHAEALGILYYRAGAGAHAVRAQVEFLKRGLGPHSAITFRVDKAEALSRQTGLDETWIRELLAQANVTPQAKLSRAAAGRLLRKLAELSQHLRTGAARRVEQKLEGN